MGENSIIQLRDVGKRFDRKQKNLLFSKNINPDAVFKNNENNIFSKINEIIAE